MDIKRIGQVTNYKALRDCGMEELAMRQLAIKPSSGVQFARTADREQKDIARQHILDLFTPAAWPGHLHILTMPGLDWRFERKLLGSREEGWMKSRVRPERTYFTCIENDRAIYFAACATLPGMGTRKAKVSILKPPRFAELGVKTKFIGGYFFANTDDLMRQTLWAYDAVWLDYTGPMSVERLKLLKPFYQRCVRNTLIVTALGARWNTSTVAAIRAAGGHSQWLAKHLPGQVLHDLQYNDTVPMTQFAVRKLDGGSHGVVCTDILA